VRQAEIAVFALLATLVPLGYSLYTQHVWEDWFITFRHSQNLCEGHGLVYNVGERVHGFTSPIGVLLPALCYWVTGETSYVPALWLFRLLSIAAFAAGGFIILRGIGAESASRRCIQYCFAILYVLDIKSVAYSTNGMETGFMLLFFAWAITLIDRSDAAAWLPRGLCWAGLMWTRPDGCIYLAALALAQLVFTPGVRRSLLGSFAKSAVLTSVLYGPWVYWAWDYYGSPVPNTVRAKAPFYLSYAFTEVVDRIYQTFPHKAAQMFGPIYFPDFWDGKPYWITIFTHCLGAFCALYWLLPVKDRLGRSASLGFVILSLYYSTGIYVFPWYVPPVTLCGLVVLASGAFTVVQAIIPWLLLSRPVAALGLVVVAVGMGYLCKHTARLMRVQEREVELGNRMAIGLWLKDHVQPGESVFMEPIGYIGYFSEAKIIDWPGLVSPEVVRLRKEQGVPGLAQMIKEIKPDWAVLRPHEVGNVLNDYEGVKSFNVKANLEKYRSTPGKNYLFFDSTFLVFKKKGLGEPYPADGTSVNSLLFPMLETPPRQVNSQTEVRAARCHDRDVLMVHAEGEMLFDLPPESRHVAGWYGILPGAYEEGSTDGVVFVVEYRPTTGQPRILFEKKLDPKNNPHDRGLQWLAVDLPVGCRGSLALKTTNHAGMTPCWDWSYWTGIKID
jgi:hypothetical protein